MMNPPLAVDEQIILHAQGGYKGYLRSGWKLGHFYLTDKRVLFSQSAGVIFEAPLSHIMDIAVEKQKYVFRQKGVICLSYRGIRTERVLKAWIIMGGLETWRRKIYEMSLLKMDEKTVDMIAAELDPDSREILWYLWEHRYAKINELAELIEAPTHMDVLLRIKRIINPAAERIIGSSVLSFEKSRVDQQTGEKILFSWWIAGEVEKKEPTERETLLDVFDEGTHITVLMELLGVREEDIRSEVAEDKLTVSADTPDRRYYEEIPLPGRVRVDQFTKTFKNGILQVRLRKEPIAE